KAISEDLLADIEKDTVDFTENYDATRKEPKVLPAKVPQLLLNGSLGIAVGMATNIAPHNLKEVCNAVIEVIEKPDINIDDLMKVITGPDFPTGGIAYNSNSIKEAYMTGKGAIVIRAVAEIIENEKNNRQQIIVSEIPYQVNKSELIAKIADLVKTKKIEGISDIRDESDRNEGIRIVIDLKANAYASKILNTLYESTSLQITFHMNTVALINGIQPRLINLKDILNEFIKHRQEIIKRRTKFDLDRAQEREHILNGLKIALDQIDKIISTIRSSETKEIAHKELVKNFTLTSIQAQAILEMRLSALAGLEQKKIFEELEQIRKTIMDLISILESKEKILEIIKTEQNEMIAKYGDARRTKISNQQIGKFSAEDLIPNKEVIVALTKSGYIKRMTVDTFKAQKRGGKGIVGISLKDKDNILQLVYTFSHNCVYFFTNKGRVFVSKVYDIPEVSRTAKGQAIVNIIQISSEEKITAILSPTIDKKSINYIFMATKNGVIKKTDLEKYNNIRKTGIIAIGLKNNDLLRFVKMTSGEDNVLLVTVKGQGI
ncbi:DNA gyrase subunit A, partial [Candidatus Berkelbacteria bacterium CG_4_9_14_3_um_filter_33_5]